MIPPGHGVFVEPTRVAKDLGFSINAPVVHETGVAKRSVADECGEAGQLIVDHLPEAQHSDGVGLGLAVPGYA